MSKRMAVWLVYGIIGLLSGFLMTHLPAIPGIVSALVSAISGAWIAIIIAAKGGASIRDEMVVRVESVSGNYTTIATLWLIMVLAIVNRFHPLPLSISDLLFAMMMFMSVLYVLLKYVLLRRGKAE